MEEADQLAERIAVIHHVRKVAEVTSRDVNIATGSGFLHVTLAQSADRNRAVAVLKALLGQPAQWAAKAGRFSVMANTPEAANLALSALIKVGIESRFCDEIAQSRGGVRCADRSCRVAR